MKIQELLETYYQEYVISSNLDQAGYDDETESLDITFLSGSKYRYFNVPQFIYDDLVNASSKGRYFWRNIRGVYEYQRLS